MARDFEDVYFQTLPSLFYINLTQVKSSDKRESQWRNDPLRFICRQVCVICSILITDVEGPAHCRRCHSKVGSIRKQDKKTIRNKPVGSIPSWPLLKFLSLGPDLSYLHDFFQ